VGYVINLFVFLDVLLGLAEDRTNVK
jgi:hypothetical protein